MDYADFETMLLAPSKFIESQANEVENFDHLNCDEEIALLIPMFGQALAEGEEAKELSRRA